jgi:hypothetical protein
MILIKVFVFLLGIYMAMRIVAAFYGIIDLWFTFKTAYLKVFQRIIGWSIITSLLILFFGHYKKSFLWGMAAYGIFYILTFLLIRISLIREVKSSGIR